MFGYERTEGGVEILRDDRRTALESILRELDDLTERVRAQLEA